MGSPPVSGGASKKTMVTSGVAASSTSKAKVNVAKSSAPIQKSPPFTPKEKTIPPPKGPTLGELMLREAAKQNAEKQRTKQDDANVKSQVSPAQNEVKQQAKPNSITVTYTDEDGNG